MTRKYTVWLGACLLLLLMLAGCERSEKGLLIRTADPSLAILVTIPEAPPLPAVDPIVVPEEEVGEVDPEPPLPPPSLDIKGNISSSGEKIYHMPGGAYYDQVKIDEAAGEMWFRTEEEAVAAGWRKSSR